RPRVGEDEGGQMRFPRFSATILFVAIAVHAAQASERPIIDLSKGKLCAFYKEWADKHEAAVAAAKKETNPIKKQELEGVPFQLLENCRQAELRLLYGDGSSAGIPAVSDFVGEVASFEETQSGSFDMRVSVECDPHADFYSTAHLTFQFLFDANGAPDVTS